MIKHRSKRNPGMIRLCTVVALAALVLNAFAGLAGLGVIPANADATPVNLAKDATLTADSSQEDASWGVKNLKDGRLVGDDSGLNLGYCSATSGEANVTLAFPASVTFNEVKIWPATSTYDNRYQSFMAKDFDLQVSSDGQTWTTVHETRGYAHPEGDTAADPYVVRFDAVNAKYLRWHIIEAAKGETIVAELEVFGEAAPASALTISMDRAALTLTEGAEDTLKATLGGDPALVGAETVGWTSSNTAVATVDANGHIKALAAGKTDIIATASPSGLSAICNVTVNAKPAQPADDDTPVNLAKDATLTADSSQEDVSWGVNNLNDGKLVSGDSGLNLGYCSATKGEANVTLTFPSAVTFNTVKLWPATSTYDNRYQGHMAKDFDLQVSNDGQTWTTIHETRGYAHPEDNTADQPYTVQFEAVNAKYLRWHIIEAAKSETIVYELEVFNAEITAPKLNITLDRPALELTVGMEDTLKAILTGDPALIGAETVRWTSAQPGVASVDANGHIKALAVGETDITATATSSGMSVTCHIYVVERIKNVFTDNITISTFWPPIGPTYIREDQYKLMADAGITYVMGAGSDVGEKQDQLKMLSWCYKYGMQMMLGDDRMGPSMAQKSPAQLEALLNEYKNVPGVAGYWLVDEPGTTVQFQSCYKTIKRLTPDKHVYINFLPDFDLNIVDDWLRYCAGVGYPAFYYQYDSYNTYNGYTNYDRMLGSLRDGWRLCEQNGVKLAGFLLSTGHGPYRQTNENDIRWQMNVSLAFGAKNLQYFTWFTSITGDTTGGIVNCNGEPTALYEGVSRVNHETLTVGTTLKDLTAYDVRVGGTNFRQMPFKEDFPVQPASAKDNVLVSLMYNKETGRNYLMIVNNDCVAKGEFTLTMDSKISALELIGNGTNQTYTFKNNTLTLSAKPGEAFLFALPADCSFIPEAKQPGATDNLAAFGYITASETVGGNGYFIQHLGDGNDYSFPGTMGWRANENLPIDVTIDFREARTFNRIDLYPAGVGQLYGAHMPKSFTVQVSQNGVDWKDVATVKGFAQSGNVAPDITFDAETARFVRIHITEMNGDCVELCEIKVFNDNGSLPKPAPYEPGKLANYNFASIAQVTATSSQESFGWALKNLTDGYYKYSTQNASNGFCSATKNECDVVFDFGMSCDMNLVKIWPALNDADASYSHDFPSACTIDVSEDGVNWTTVATVSDYKHSAGPLEISFEQVSARYLRWHIIEAIRNEVCVSEFEVFCMSKADDTPAETDTEVDPGTVTEPESQPESQPESETEPVTETPTDAATGTTPETGTPTGDGTDPATNPADTDPTKPAKSGCASVLTAASCVVLIAVGGAVTMRKRKED